MLKIIQLIALILPAALLSKELALTFDDSPNLSSPIFGASKRSETIRRVLKEKGVEQVLFFATPRRPTIATRHGYVTLDNSEWVIEKALHDALKADKSIDYKKLGKIYVDHLLAEIEFFEEVSRSYFDHEVKHILLLHENEIAALFLGDLIDAIRSKGWTIVSPLEAYRDPVSQMEPKTLKLNQGRVMALAVDKGHTVFRNPLETIEVVRERINNSQIFSDKR